MIPAERKTCLIGTQSCSDISYYDIICVLDWAEALFQFQIVSAL